MDKQQNDYGYITRYKMGGTTYEVETTFSGTETLKFRKTISNLAENTSLSTPLIELHQFVQTVQKYPYAR